jgi:hypothetical protein
MNQLVFQATGMPALRLAARALPVALHPSDADQP